MTGGGGQFKPVLLRGGRGPGQLGRSNTPWWVPAAPFTKRRRPLAQPPGSPLAALLASLEGQPAPCQVQGLNWGCNIPGVLWGLCLWRVWDPGGLEDCCARFLSPQVRAGFPGLSASAVGSRQGMQLEGGPQADFIRSARVFGFFPWQSLPVWKNWEVLIKNPESQLLCQTRRSGIIVSTLLKDRGCAGLSHTCSSSRTQCGKSSECVTLPMHFIRPQDLPLLLGVLA